MQIESIQRIWDDQGERARMRVRVTERDPKDQQIQTTLYYYYTVYDRRGQLEESTRPSVDLRA